MLRKGDPIRSSFGWRKYGRKRRELAPDQWLQGGRTVRGVIQGDSQPRDFIPGLVNLFMAGRMPIDRLITRYHFCRDRPRCRRRRLARRDKTGAAVAAVKNEPSNNSQMANSLAALVV